ncbi:pseudouridine synthase [Nocardiopsis metallicus]|uniref:Pseudouridine synthase n=1 Tax=Nocardiopsis metallicus TaxID=179819 RepID=A0A840WCA1_9ACTN|nr:pseudouridine synthase [Nocardiopsis metallicus]MBB5489367.1 pseudouridine synthase [Nocardiopsis metallicus]
MSTPNNERSRGARDDAPRGERGDYDNRGGRGPRDDRNRDDRRGGGRYDRDERPRRDDRGRDDRGRGGYQSRDDNRGRGGYQGRDDRRDDKRGGGYQSRDDRGRGGYQGRDDRGGRSFERRDDRDRRPQGRDDSRGGRFDRDDRPRRDDRGRGGYQGRDDSRGGRFDRDDRPRRDDRGRGGYQGRDDRGGRSFERRDDNRGGYRGDRDRRDDRGRGGYQGRDDKRGGGYQGRDDRGGRSFERRDDRDRRPQGRDDSRGGRFDRDDRPRRDDRGRDDRPRRDDRHGGDFKNREDRPRRDAQGRRMQGGGKSGGGYQRRDDNRGGRPQNRHDRPRRDEGRDPDQRPIRRDHAPVRDVKSENQLSKAARERLNALRADYNPRDEDRHAGDPRDTYTDVPGGIRLQKALAAAGVASRRASEEMIAAGRVSVDGQIVRRFGARVDPEASEIRVDDMRVVTAPDKLYFALNKPRGVVSTMWDPEGRPTLADYAGQTAERIFHVGRLDTETEGLILLTNDGDLANRLTHPRYKVIKTYVAKVDGPVPHRVVREIQKGVELDDGPVKVDSFRVVDNDSDQAMVEIRLHEGRKHIVRRLMEAVGHPVADLARTQVGPIDLNNLRLGTMRALSSREVGELYKAAGL